MTQKQHRRRVADQQDAGRNVLVGLLVLWFALWLVALIVENWGAL